MFRHQSTFLILVALGFLLAPTALAQPGPRATYRMPFSWSNADREELREFPRVFEPQDRVEPRPEIAGLADGDIQKLVNATRREIRQRVLSAQFRARYSEQVAKALLKSYRLQPVAEIQGLSVLTNEELQTVYLEARSAAADASLMTSSCELEIVYDVPPATAGDPLAHVLPGESQILNSAKSVVAIVDSAALTFANGSYDLWTRDFDVIDGFFLCDFSLIFGMPVTSVMGTGFLVDGDKIVTAAHVAKKPNFLEYARFVFDYTLPSPGLTKTSFGPDQVYKATEISVMIEDESGRDLAVIQLEKAPADAGYPSLVLRDSGRIADHEMVYTIGHPLGLPQMYTGAKGLYENWPCAYFMSTLDTYDFHSGSPVINADTGIVEGILVSGAKEYRSFCDCEAPVASTSEHGLSTSFVVRAKIAADAIAHGGSVFVENHSDETLVVRTVEEKPVEPSATVTMPYAESMTLLQLPYDDGLGETIYTCTLEYRPLPGETWAIVKSRDSGKVIMVRCADEVLSAVY